jgi:hypothetical protein
MIQLNNIFSIDGPGRKYVAARYHTLSLRTSHAEPFSSTGLSICHHDLVLQLMSKNTFKKIHNNEGLIIRNLQILGAILISHSIISGCRSSLLVA